MAPPHTFTVGLIQMACTPDPEENLARAARRVEEAARAGARAICLPELFRYRYFCQSEDPDRFDLAEPVPGPTTDALCGVARDSGVVIVTPVFERRAPGLYHNSAVVIDGDGTIAGLYRKMHIPDDPGYYEKFYFAPGDLGFRAFDTRVGRIGVLICWDQWFPEAARLTALQDVSVILCPTAIGWHPHEKEAHGAVQRESWQTVQRGHAIANGVFLAAVNRVRYEPASEGERGIEFWGSSFLADPQGVLVAEASTDGEETLLGEVDLDRLESVRRHWPFLRDRRVDAYTGIDQRHLGPGRL